MEEKNEHGAIEQYQWAVYHENKAGRQKWFDEYPTRRHAETAVAGMLKHPEYYGKVTLVEILSNWEDRLLE